MLTSNHFCHVEEASWQKCDWCSSTICSCSARKSPWPFGPGLDPGHFQLDCNRVSPGGQQTFRQAPSQAPNYGPDDEEWKKLRTWYLGFFADRVWQVWKYLGVQPAVGRRYPVSCFSGCSSQRSRSSLCA